MVSIVVAQEREDVGVLHGDVHRGGIHSGELNEVALSSHEGEGKGKDEGNLEHGGVDAVPVKKGK